MKQQPSRLKYKKYHKPSSSSLYLKEQKNFIPLKGQFGLKILENGKLTYNQIEACRKSIRRMLKKNGIIFIRVFTYASLTKKPLASRMGKGKGSHNVWVCPVRKGQIICEVICYDFNKINLSIKALKIAGSKLPLRSIVISNIY